MSGRTLVVEDKIHRQAWFRFNLAQPRDLTVTAAQAIDWLQTRIYATLWLDHDLGEGNPPGRTVSDLADRAPDRPAGSPHPRAF